MQQNQLVWFLWLSYTARWVASLGSPIQFLWSERRKLEKVEVREPVPVVAPPTTVLLDAAELPTLQTNSKVVSEQPHRQLIGKRNPFA
jgi:hypothetical protein